jgi:hypothetical protein
LASQPSEQSKPALSASMIPSRSRSSLAPRARFRTVAPVVTDQSSHAKAVFAG